MACEARDEVNPDAIVLGCVAPLESCYDPKQAPDYETCKKEHRQMMKLLLDAGCDFILLETQCSAEEAIAAAEVAQEIAPGHWAITFSLPVDKVGILRCGTPFGDVVHNFKDAAFVGFNCIDAKSMTSQVKYLRSVVPKK